MNKRTVTIIPLQDNAPPTAEHPLRVAAYCRVSSPSDEQALSLETQIQYYTDKIDGNPFWKNVGVFADMATGRNTKRRGEFKKLLARCHAGKVDLILTKSISRFGRNSLEAIHALRRLHGLNIDVYFEKENIHLSAPAAQHVIEIYCALAQNESENKSHNIKWGIKVGFQSGASGYQHFACYGYRYDEKKQTLLIEPEEAEVVRLIFDLRLQGKSYGAISNVLVQREIPSPKGNLIWNRECIRKMLCNEKYAGTVVLQKTYVEDFFTGKQKKNVGQKERYYYKDNHEAIVSIVVFERVQGL